MRDSKHTKIICKKIYDNPQSYTDEYERGICHGMMYLAEKLIWAEQYYLDARTNTNPQFSINESAQIDMFKILNDTLHDFQSKSKSWKLFSNDEQLKEYNNYIKKLFN